jgi:hypothetical protein
MYVALLGLLSYVCFILAGNALPEARVLYLRFWTLFAIGTFAAAPPHLLLPDPKRIWFPFLNPSPLRLFFREVRRWLPIVLLLILPSLVLAYYMPGREELTPVLSNEHQLAALFTMLGTAFFSFWRYMRIGRVSQEWQEGKRGRLYSSVSNNSTITLGLPHGLVPVLTQTSFVFLTGTATVLLAAYMTQTEAAPFAWLPGFVLLTGALLGLVAQSQGFDAAFYRTNALYAEVFRSTGGIAVAEREPIPYAGVYWVPSKWKGYAWAGLCQLDRRLPLGRYIFLGHLLLWLLFMQGANATIIAAYLLTFSTLKNIVIAMHGTRPMAPGALQVTLQPPVGWTMTRFFMNLRWTLPLLLSLVVVAAVSERFTFVNAFAWALVDLLLSFLTAWTTTSLSESRYRRQYA